MPLQKQTALRVWWAGFRGFIRMRNQTFHIAAVLCCFVSILPASLQAQGPVPDSPAIEQRVDAMIAKLTLEQKLD